MHILIIHQAFASLDEPGGTRHFEFARLLTSRGHKVTVIASPVSYITGGHTKQAREEMEGVTILRASVYEAHHKSFFHRVLAFFSFMISSFWIGLGVSHVDLVWGTSPPIFQGVTAWTLARIKGAKFLFEVRDLWPQFAMAVGVLKSPFLIRLSEWLERFLYRRADRVMVNSPGFIDHIKVRGAMRVDLIPNGADPSMFDPEDDGRTFREANGLQGKFVVLYAGAHGMSNDLGVVLEAAKILLSEKNIQFVFIGDGKEKQALQVRARDMLLMNVMFLPSVPKAQMAHALAGANACVAILKPINEYKTTYPNKVFDYMAAGKPIILAIDGVIRDVVHKAHCGIFVQPGSAFEVVKAIRMLASNVEYGREMGSLGRKYLEKNFSRAVIGDKLIGLLEEFDSENGKGE
jgi:glycosyltransferase involved in cell wall biosynthesis